MALAGAANNDDAPDEGKAGGAGKDAAMDLRTRLRDVAIWATTEKGLCGNRCGWMCVGFVGVVRGLRSPVRRKEWATKTLFGVSKVGRLAALLA